MLRVHAETISNKSKDIIIPVIRKRVISDSTIHTDEHKTHSLPSKIGFVHNFVCHKYSFIN
ncbi:hypothetical protein H311_04665, partial [Anncaliia algerae PRA109]